MVEVNLNLDLASNGNTPVVDAVQNDSNSRVISANLYAGPTPWTVPDGCTVAVSYRKPDGATGVYDTLPNSSPAVVVSKNNVRATLAAQVLTVSGDVSCAIVVTDTKTLNRVASFPITVRVAADPGAGKPVSNDYYKYSTMEDLNNALGNVSPAIPVTMTGTAVSTDMVSPVEHDVDCRIKTNIIPLPYVSKSIIGDVNGVDYGVDGAKITISGTAKGGTVFTICDHLKLDNHGQKLYWSGSKGCSNVRMICALYDVRNEWVWSEQHTDIDIYIDLSKYPNADNLKLQLVREYDNRACSGTVYPVCIESAVPADYIPHVPDLTKVIVTQNPGGKTFKPSSDGTVTGMKSISPSMTITTDNPGANLEVTYNADTKRYIDHKFTELQSAILSTGGNI